MHAPLLILPGRNNSGPQHWQTLWQARRPDALRLEPSNWSEPELGDWMLALELAMKASPAPPMLVAHSMGCLLSICWASQHHAKFPIAGMFLVAPPNYNREGFPASFSKVPQTPVPYPTLVISSTNDPYCPIDVAKKLAASWKAGFVSVGERGHIATEPGNGSWDEGWHLLKAFAAGIRVQID